MLVDRYGVDVIVPDRLPDMVITTNPHVALRRPSRRLDSSIATQILFGVNAMLFDLYWPCPMSVHTMFNPSISHP